MTTDLVGQGSDIASAKMTAPTAADAAVLQLAEEPAHQNPTDKVASVVVQYNSGSLYDRVFAMALPDIATVAAHKNVRFAHSEQELALRYALKGVSQKTLKRAAQGNDDACWLISLPERPASPCSRKNNHH